MVDLPDNPLEDSEAFHTCLGYTAVGPRDGQPGFQPAASGDDELLPIVPERDVLRADELSEQLTRADGPGDRAFPARRPEKRRPMFQRHWLRARW